MAGYPIKANHTIAKQSGNENMNEFIENATTMSFDRSKEAAEYGQVFYGNPTRVSRTDANSRTASFRNREARDSISEQDNLSSRNKIQASSGTVKSKR